VKLYALAFYHAMEFTSATPPPQLLPYWLPEGPYLLALGASLWRMRHPGSFNQTTTPATAAASSSQGKKAK
jgi:hypothetical protein